MTNPPWCIGIDGCPAGWVAVSRVGVYIDSSLEDLLARLTPTVVAIDMPIGLSSNQPRACDRVARRLLGRPRSSSVFPTPTRAALTASTHSQASALNAAASGKRLSAQAYNLLAKIREVDSLLRASRHWQQRTFETHPEVSFAAMNAGAAIAASKKTAAGREHRQRLVAKAFGGKAYTSARHATRRRDAADDDIADAFACLFSAERIARGEHITLPESGEFDACGLPMRICY